MIGHKKGRAVFSVEGIISTIKTFSVFVDRSPSFYLVSAIATRLSKSCFPQAIRELNSLEKLTQT